MGQVARELARKSVRSVLAKARPSHPSLVPNPARVAQLPERDDSNVGDEGESPSAGTNVEEVEPDKRAGTVLKTDCAARRGERDLRLPPFWEVISNQWAVGSRGRASNWLLIIGRVVQK